jgi:hypothetical protein
VSAQPYKYSTVVYSQRNSSIGGEQMCAAMDVMNMFTHARTMRDDDAARYGQMWQLYFKKYVEMHAVHLIIVGLLVQFDRMDSRRKMHRL